MRDDAPRLRRVSRRDNPTADVTQNQPIRYGGSGTDGAARPRERVSPSDTRAVYNTLSSAFGNIFECTCLLSRQKAALPLSRLVADECMRALPPAESAPTRSRRTMFPRRNFHRSRRSDGFYRRLRRSSSRPRRFRPRAYLEEVRYPKESPVGVSPKHDGQHFDCHLHEDKRVR